MNNIPVQIIDGEKILPCGAIYCTDRIIKVFEDILGKDKVKIISYTYLANKFKKSDQ